jgi:hypothetical protein
MSMALSPFASKFNCAVIRPLASAALIFFAFALQIVLAQRARREAADKGPRATGLIELAPGGKAHLIPITIMVDGKFYDAAAYKGTPVPMALEFGTVYEAEQSGVSQGLFTVKTAFSGATEWRGEGTWQSEAEIQAEAAKKKAREAAKPAKKNDDQDAPPVLRRAGPDKSGPDKGKTPGPEPAGTTPAAGPKPSSGSAPIAAASPPVSAPASMSSPTFDSDEADPDRPHLRRGKAPSEAIPRSVSQAAEKPKTPVQTEAKGATLNAAGGTSSSGVVIIPAVSDADGPEPRPYTYALKPDEERQFRTKMLALAAVEVNARAKLLAPERTKAPASRTTTRKGKAPEPTFEDVQLRVFDLSNSNEPVLVLTAKASLPASKAAPDKTPPISHLLTLVAREDIYGELHKALANMTDREHLDVLPRLELIDAVDVDGDGRGELLFRQVSDTGSGYVVYRVIGNKLWPLYQSPIG